jgi:hypothetical protein
VPDDPGPGGTHATSRALSRAVTTTCPSMPAVRRPALRSVTRRTLTSVFARERSISFCRLRTRLRSPACDAVKIVCRSRCTSSSTARQSIACQSRSIVLRSVHHHPTGSPPKGAGGVAVSNLSIGSSVVVTFAPQAHLTLSAPFQVRHQPYPASYPRPHRWRPTLAWSRFPVAFRRTSIRFWVILSR